MLMKIATSLKQFYDVPRKQRHHWYIPEGVVVRYPRQENKEPLVILEESETLRLLPVSGSAMHMQLRRSVRDKLSAAATKVFEESNGKYGIAVTDAFRSLLLQRKYFAEIREKIHQKEGLSGKKLWDRVTQFIADPDLCPPHSTGGAVDCTLVEISTGIKTDMGTPVDSIQDRSQTWSDEVTSDQRKNRLLLYSAMISLGFINLPTEWWHYSYGDQYWAAFYEKPYAIYNSLESGTIE